MIDYLNRLEIKVENGRCISPWFRIDLGVKADIAEEVARLYDYNNIPDTIIRGVAKAQLTEKQKFERRIKQAVLAMGVNEIATFSFISPKYFDKIRLPQDSKLRNTVKIMNPLGEDTSVMRTTMLPSVCEVLSRNYNYRNPEAYVFEMGNEYLPVEGEELPDEPVRLCIGVYDTKDKDSFDFFDLKGIIEGIMSKAGVRSYEVSRPDESCTFDEAAAFHPGRTAVITCDGVQLGIFGELHPETCENYGIGARAYAAKINIPELMEKGSSERIYTPLPKFPATTRDISVMCDAELPSAELEKAIRNAVGSILEKVTLFDVYTGEQIGEGKKSVSYSISMRSHEGTLTDEQADKAMDKVVKALAALGAERR